MDYKKKETPSVAMMIFGPIGIILGLVALAFGFMAIIGILTSLGLGGAKPQKCEQDFTCQVYDDDSWRY